MSVLSDHPSALTAAVAEGNKTRQPAGLAALSEMWFYHQYQKGEIAELKATSLQLTSRVDAIDARFRPRPSSHPEYIEVNARFDDVCQMVLGRINPIAKEDDPTAAYAASKLSELVEEHLGELSRRQRGKLAEVIGRFQAGRDYYAVQVDTKISPNTQAFRATIFGSCAKDLRSLLEG